MTNFNADSGIQDIFDKLEDDDLFALARTVTQGFLKINSRDGKMLKLKSYCYDEYFFLRCYKRHIKVLSRRNKHFTEKSNHKGNTIFIS